MKYATLLFLAVLALFVIGAREKIAHHLRALSFMEKLGLYVLCFSLFLLIALRAFGIIDIVQILFN